MGVTTITAQCAMPYAFEWQGPVVHLRFFGGVTVRELADAVTEIAARPSFDDQRFHVVDFGAATMPELNLHVLEALAPALGATTTNPYIHAIFLPDDAQTRAFATLCAPVLAGMRSVQFFTDRVRAEEWISEQSMTAGRIS